ncbi:MAG: cyclopropane-fatty-acyl-phospholipid synthase family protein [Acidobacteriota bacterium]|nr:cyclopropane-fatty-acyl-phospholipid synthase family protein [Acidobacteriota bacterium]
MRFLIDWAERGLLPSPLVRIGIQGLLAHRLHLERVRTKEEHRLRLENTLQELRKSHIALFPEKANRQHYEVPVDFFKWVLGDYLKYSSCYWFEGVDNLSEAEAAMLKLTCERAGLEDGMDILELGCGWGSLTLWMARHYPHSRILSMSNSYSQREFIQDHCRRLGFSNVQVLTEDINDFDTDRLFDRIVSVEMLEHVRNYQRLFSRLARWLNPRGRLFVHVFCHRYLCYPFENQGATDWMGQYFFTGGLMPSADLFSYFQDDLMIEQQWWVDGTHYSQTARAWLANLNHNQEKIMDILPRVYGSASRQWLNRWRIFFMACEELFGYRQGQEWGVSHYCFQKTH